jgi:hypothetical protein
MSPVASPRHRAPARYQIYIGSENQLFVLDTWTDDIAAGPFEWTGRAESWIRRHAGRA